MDGAGEFCGRVAEGRFWRDVVQNEGPEKVRGRLLWRQRGGVDSAVPGVDRSMRRRFKAEKESSPARLEREMDKRRRKTALGRVLSIP